MLLAKENSKEIVGNGGATQLIPHYLKTPDPTHYETLIAIQCTQYILLHLFDSSEFNAHHSSSWVMGGVPHEIGLVRT